MLKEKKVMRKSYFNIILPIKASQNLSSSALSSDSVGSTISVPTTGQEVVGEWKPVSDQENLVCTEQCYWNKSRVNPITHQSNLNTRGINRYKFHQRK